MKNQKRFDTKRIALGNILVSESRDGAKHTLAHRNPEISKSLSEQTARVYFFVRSISSHHNVLLTLMKTFWSSLTVWKWHHNKPGQRLVFKNTTECENVFQITQAIPNHKPPPDKRGTHSRFLAPKTLVWCLLSFHILANVCVSMLLPRWEDKLIRA